jgi:hypothetical protein
VDRIRLIFRNLALKTLAVLIAFWNIGAENGGVPITTPSPIAGIRRYRILE